MKNKNILLLLTLGMISLLTACDPPLDLSEVNDIETELTGATKYIVTATPIGTTGIADYLLTSNSLEEGMVTTKHDGIEQDGSYRYYISHKNRFFSLLYGQGNPGAVTTYRLDGTGKLTKLTNFQSETVQVSAAVQNDILLIKVPRSGNESANMFRVDARKYQIAGEQQVNIVKLAGNGERAHFNGATQVGNKVFLPYMSIKGAQPDVFGTAYPDSTWVAVFSYPELKLEKIIRDNRTGFIGAYFNNGLVEIENGDVYGFSGASATRNSKPVSTNPSAIVRINKGATEFDKSYFFNIERNQADIIFFSDLYWQRQIHLTPIYRTQCINRAGWKIAIADVINKTFKWVTGSLLTLQKLQLQIILLKMV